MGRVLLTGAGGFVGGAILRRLRADGREVVALSSSRDGQDASGIRWRRMDLLNASPAETARLVGDETIDACIHAAWYTNHSDYLTAEINHSWTKATLRLEAGFRHGGGRRFVGLGTCIEYDIQSDGGRFAEERTPLRPDTLYAQCKAETFERLARRSAGHNGDFAWARLFFIYGPGDRAGRLIPYVVSKLQAGEPVAPRFGGLMRDYIHVDDLADQIVRIAASDVQGPINTGTGKAERLADIFTLAGELAGRPELVVVNDAIDAAQGERIEADMSRFERLVGSPDTRSLRDGLTEIMSAAR